MPPNRSPQRLVAIGLLAQTDFSVAGTTLQNLIDPQQPAEIQVAAVRALGQMNDPAVAQVLVQKERWSSYTPPVRTPPSWQSWRIRI